MLIRVYNDNVISCARIVFFYKVIVLLTIPLDWKLGMKSFEQLYFVIRYLPLACSSGQETKNLGWLEGDRYGGKGIVGPNLLARYCKLKYQK